MLHRSFERQAFVAFQCTGRHEIFMIVKEEKPPKSKSDRVLFSEQGGEFVLEQCLLWNDSYASVSIERIFSEISTSTLLVNTRFCLICLFKLERQGKIILKIQNKSAINTEFAPDQKTLAVCLQRRIHYGFVFYLANGNATLIWITRNPGVEWREQWIHTLSREARQKSVTTSWDCFPTSCRLDFGVFLWFCFVLFFLVCVLF